MKETPTKKGDAVAALKKNKDEKTPKKDTPAVESKSPKKESKTPNAKTPKQDATAAVATPKSVKKTMKGGIAIEEIKEGTGPEAKVRFFFYYYYYFYFWSFFLFLSYRVTSLI